jgi:arylsulfatase A-like enzyme
MGRVSRVASRWPWVRAGCVLVAWFVALAVENVVIGVAYRDVFAGSWEMALARRYLTPLALGALLPAAIAVSLASVVAERAAVSRRARGALAALGLLAGGATAWGVSYGRHMASPLVRAPFVLGVALAAAWIVARIAPEAVRLATARPRLVALLGLALAALAWLADARVLPRLYPAFHFALLVVLLVALALAALVLRLDPGGAPTRGPSILGGVALAAASLALAAAPWLASRLGPADNLRLVLVEHAPLLGRAAWLASRLAPPPPIDDAPSATGPGEVARALDWTGRDVVLLTVDALRADHLTSYGYARPTTPNIDALAREGARFDAAYCPTPHTSYSITSLMTGKYMRPLLALGLGDDSDTWASLMRRYGYRTAAFYPPAVFFIDAERFASFRARGLDFEYRKEEFAAPPLRASQVEGYLDAAKEDVPLFLWVHFFEPHEPYVMHPDHPFGGATPGDVDAYDSEIAAADEGIGTIVRAVRRRRPGAIVIVTADHGEEFGDHGGRYHGTTVYEEQARVPLVIAGPEVPAGRVVRAPVQTIDLLPTVVSALGIPRPARLRGRDLGPLLAGKQATPAEGADDEGLAFAETDDYTMLARGPWRLVCERRADACNLFDRDSDPGERRSRTREEPKRTRDMRRAMAAIEGEHGRFEQGEATAWPEALRRGIAGDAEAALDVAALLDDVSPTIRARAAEVTFDLHAAEATAQMRRAARKSDDETVRRYAALSLLRVHERAGASPLADALLKDPDVAWRRRAALAWAEAGDDRGAAELAAWWSDRKGLDFERTRALLRALGSARARAAVPALARDLDDVRLRPAIAETLAAIGDASARPALLAWLGREPYVTARVAEARALVTLGARAELRPALTRYAGLPEPMEDVMGLAARAGLLAPGGSGWSSAAPVPHVEVRLDPPHTLLPLRLLVATRGPEPAVVTVDGAPVTPLRVPERAGGDVDGATHVFDLGVRPARALALRVTASSAEATDAPDARAAPASPVDAGGAGPRDGVLGVWIVPSALPEARTGAAEAGDGGQSGR